MLLRCINSGTAQKVDSAKKLNSLSEPSSTSQWQATTTKKVIYNNLKATYFYDRRIMKVSNTSFITTVLFRYSQKIMNQTVVLYLKRIQDTRINCNSKTGSFLLKQASPSDDLHANTLQFSAGLFYIFVSSSLNVAIQLDSR